MNVFELFTEGGLFGMAVLTILLVLLLFAAWKAPAWVKETGLAALAFGFFAFLLPLYVGLLTMSMTDVEPQIVYGGFRMALIPLIYGDIIYFVSLIIRVVQKPRI